MTICKKFRIQIEWTMTGQSRTTISRRKELCTWCCVCVLKCSWRTKPSYWTVRRPTPMTKWKPRSSETSTRSTWNPAMTWHTWWTRECARSCYSLLSPCSVSAVTLILLHTSHGSRCSRVCLIPSMHEVSVLSDFLDLLITFIFLLSFLINLKQFLLPFNFTEVK